MYIKKLIFMVVLALATNLAVAQQIDAGKFYFGAGLSHNSISGLDDAIGYQIFAGYPLDVDLGGGRLSIEVGYMDSGNFDAPFGLGKFNATGVWANGVGEWTMTNDLRLIGRIGMDFGDDDGIMLGGGVGFKMAKNLDLRVEYVIRDNIDSLQANLVFYQR